MSNKWWNGPQTTTGELFWLEPHLANSTDAHAGHQASAQTWAAQACSCSRCPITALMYRGLGYKLRCSFSVFPCNSCACWLNGTALAGRGIYSQYNPDSIKARK